MADPLDADRTVDEAPSDPLDSGLAVAFGADSGRPLPAAGSVLRALGAAPVVLREPTTEPADPVVKPHSDAVPADAPAGLQLHGEIARGGMGAVLKGRDTELGRDVAVKVLLETHQGRTELVQRFVEEAQIAGQLQHPGVVPVYAMGQLPDRRPYFTMKLVKGKTLAKLLAERTDPSQDWPRLLKVFEQVCQALAYAHARGVIHRDLKPSNVMVGAFGEVQVMDWGLAKVLKQGGIADAKAPAPAEATVIRAARSESATPAPAGSQTQAGAVLGTPAYMAPEQARGEVAGMDERCDVFGLGAILCQILTGQAPYAGADGDEVCARAARAELGDAFARLDGCRADAELVALAKRCLSANPGGRPRDAGALVAELAAYLESVEARLRRAELERAAAEVKAHEERKRRRVQLALAAAVVLLVVGGGGGAWWAQQQRQEHAALAARQRQEADAAVAGAMAEARLLLGQAQAEPLGDAAKYREALAAAHKAAELARAGASSDAARQQAAELAHMLEAEAGLAVRDRVLLAALLEVRGPHEGPKFQRDDDGLLMELAEPSAEEQFAAAFRAWGLDVDASPTAEAAARLKGRPAGVVAEVIAALDEWTGERRRARPPGKWQPLSDLAAALDEPGSRSAELRDMLARGGLARERALGALAVALRPVPVPFDAGPGEDRARLRRLATETDVTKEPALGLLTLARALRVAGDDERAERLLRTALRARPQEVVLHYALGDVLSSWQPPRWAEAVECYATARALRPEVAERLANALVQSGRVAEGLALYEQSVRDRPNPWLLCQYGFALNSQGRYQEAEAALREALRLKPDYARAHANLGAALNRQGRHKEAEAACREAIHLKPDLSAAHNNLGNALIGQRRYKEAEAACREAIRLKPDGPYNNLGAALNRQGRYKEAEAACREAIRLKPDLYQAYTNLGAALNNQGRYKEAEAAWREAIRLKPDLPGAYTNLGAALNNQGRYKEAEAASRAAIRLKPDLPAAHANLGRALWSQGRFADAEAACREAIRLKPDLPFAHHILGTALSHQGRHEEAEAAYREAIRLFALDGRGQNEKAEATWRAAIRLRPDDPQAHCNLGEALLAQGRFAEALELLRRGHALGSAAPGWRYPSADWVRQCERLVEFDLRLPAILRGEAEPASAAERIEFAQLCLYKRLHVTAFRLYADAFATEPKLADDLRAEHRYAAAYSAVLAAAGQGEDARLLPDKVVALLRQQALRALRADLALRAQMAGREDSAANRAVREKLQYWRGDAALTSVRDKAALDKLPDDERDAWRKLWADVDALLKRVPEKPK